MLQSIKHFAGFSVPATDGEIGKVYDFYFDDSSWIVRYLVLEQGKWLPGRRVLLSPVTFGQADGEKKILPVLLNKKQIEKSPSITWDEPVSRQKEKELVEHYDWPIYWPSPSLSMQYNIPLAKKLAEDDKAESSSEGDPNLRSIREVSGYHIQASDGEIGHVEDFIVDDDDWHIRYLVIDTKNWLPGKKVLVSPLWVDSIDWEKKKVFMAISRETVKDSPEYDPSQPVNRVYEERLYDFYGRPKYWKE